MKFRTISVVSLIISLAFATTLAASPREAETGGDGEATESADTGDSGGNGLYYLSFHANAAGKFFFFNNIDLQDAAELAKKAGNENADANFDFTGRKYKMRYAFDPVYLVAFKGFLSWKFLSFDSSYETDRVWKGGGTIEESDKVAERLTNSKTVSEILKFGIGFFGLNTSLRSVQFDFGQAEVVNVATGKVEGEGNLKLNITEVDITYDFGYRQKDYKTGKSKKKVWYKPFVGYKFIDYQLPRIVYQMEDTDGDPGFDKYEYLNESAPQPVSNKLHMLGFGWQDLEHRGKKNWDFIYSVSAYAGLGTTQFDVGSSETEVQPPLFGVLGRLQPGLSYQFSGGGLKTTLRVMYELNFYFYGTFDGEDYDKIFSNENDLGARTYTFGQVDLYHGLQFAFQATY